jgi:plastocyanin
MLSNSHSRLSRALALLVLAPTLALAACGGSATATRTTTSTGGAPAASVDHVQIKEFKYAPATITVALGTKITWTNHDSAPHTATSGTSPNSDGVFDSGTIKKGESKTATVSKRGTFTYYCAFHPFMKATVVVK